jgi:multiple sugar transport system permease protein
MSRSLTGRSAKHGAFVITHRLLVLVVLVYLVLPFLWMLTYSIYPAGAVQRRDPDFNPSQITFGAFGRLLSDNSFVTPMLNSTIVAVATTLICMALGSACAYAIARFKFRGRQPLLLGLMTVQAIPVIVLAVPLFILLRELGLYDTLVGLIVTYSAFILPLVVWMMVGFFEEIPESLVKAARIDGCSRWQVLFRIAFPLAGTGMAATAIFAFVTAWGDFFLAKVLTGVSSQTLPVKTAGFQGLFAMDYTSAATAGVITSIPVLLLAIGAQKWLIKGLTEGAVKG